MEKFEYNFANPFKSDTILRGVKKFPLEHHVLVAFTPFGDLSFGILFCVTLPRNGGGRKRKIRTLILFSLTVKSILHFEDTPLLTLAYFLLDYLISLSKINFGTLFLFGTFFEKKRRERGGTVLHQ